jgi:hypothetical protein
MKRFPVSLMATVLFISIFAVSFMYNETSVFAKTRHAKTEAFTGLAGKIIAIDTTQNQVTIQNNKGVKTTFSADPNQIASLKTDEWVNVTLKADGKTAETIKLITKEGKKNK